MDLARRIIRGILGTNSRLYKSGSTALDCLATVRKEGLNMWRILKNNRNENRLGDAPMSVSLKNLKYPILVRPGTQDADTVIDNVIREEYGRTPFTKDPEWMIDAGAYIGDTAAYFLSKYPKLKVIALEPNPSSHEIASQNLKPYGDRVILLKKGLFSEVRNQNFGGLGTSASITGASINGSESEIECVTIPSLLEQYSIPHLDILKMDIEGAEEPIFASNPEKWLDRTGLVIIEIHGSKCQELISRVLKENRFSMTRYRSIWYCKPKN
ncbi:MAG: FkbM family methyltransferase [Gemmataceae bacterium]